MSYCRWSKESDLHIYEYTQGGYNVHVRGNRGNSNMTFFDTYVDGMPDMAKHDEWMKGLEYLDHPDSGGSYNFKTIPEVLAYIEKVRGEGLICPEYAVEKLKADLEADTKPVIP